MVRECGSGSSDERAVARAAATAPWQAEEEVKKGSKARGRWQRAPVLTSSSIAASLVAEWCGCAARAAAEATVRHAKLCEVMPTQSKGSSTRSESLPIGHASLLGDMFL